jgi:hypothetical protein
MRPHPDAKALLLSTLDRTAIEIYLGIKAADVIAELNGYLDTHLISRRNGVWGKTSENLAEESRNPLLCTLAATYVLAGGLFDEIGIGKPRWTLVAIMDNLAETYYYTRILTEFGPSDPRYVEAMGKWHALRARVATRDQPPEETH